MKILLTAQKDIYNPTPNEKLELTVTNNEIIISKTNSDKQLIINKKEFIQALKPLLLFEDSTEVKDIKPTTVTPQNNNISQSIADIVTISGIPVE